MKVHRIDLEAARRRDLQAAPALIALLEVHGIMHRAARLADHAAQGQILEGRAEAARGMALGVRQIDQERGVLDHTGHFPVLNVLVRSMMRVEIFLVQSGSGDNGAADRF